MVTTIYVDIEKASSIEDGGEKHPYSKIQKAIDSAGAGDTIKVAAGTYSENVKISKPVCLEGAGAGVTTVKANNQHTDVFHIKTRGAKISGFTIIGGRGSSTTYPNGIHLAGARDTIISDNIILHNHSSGILLTQIAANNTIENNIISSEKAWTYGIHISQARNNRIVNNLISKVYRGIFIAGWPNDGNVIIKNVITNIPYRAFEIWGDTSGIVIEYNNICGNSGYNFYNCAKSIGGSSAQDIKAPNNYWGTVDRSEIEAKIYDNKDNPAEGRVDYEPFLETFFFPNPLSSLPVTNIQGIGDVYAGKLAEHDIVNVEDLASADALTLAELTGISMLEVYEWKRKAELFLSVKIDCASLAPLLDKRLVDILEMSDEQLANTAGQSIGVANDLKRRISTILVSLDRHVFQSLFLKDVITGPCPMLTKAELMEKQFETDEKARINLTLENVGSSIAEEVVGRVISTLPKLKVLSGELNFGSILRQSTSSAEVELETLNIEPGNYTLELCLNVKNVKYPMTQHFNVEIVSD